jgi:segregation and condensation protein B
MSDIELLPDIERIVGSLLFVARAPLTIDQIKRVFNRVAETEGGRAAEYAGLRKERIREALDAIGSRISRDCPGFKLVEVAGGYRLENELECGPWVRELLEKSKPRTLSIPALETLAIVAYRQPCTRAQIEDIRGVAVDQILRNLMAMQLVKICGRSELPGRPWLFGTTPKFLEHFGLKSLEDLPSHQDLKRFDEEQQAARQAEIEESLDSEQSDAAEEPQAQGPDIEETLEAEVDDES